jgi:hypothetical protein
VTVTASTFEGVAVYVVDLIDDAGLSRSYVDRRTFHELRSEDIAPGPHGPTVTQSYDVTWEVLPGNQAPSAAQLTKPGTSTKRR